MLPGFLKLPVLLDRLRRVVPIILRVLRGARDAGTDPIGLAIIALLIAAGISFKVFLGYTQQEFSLPLEDILLIWKTF